MICDREKKTVLVTGASGALGRVAVKGLRAAGYQVFGLDLNPCPACHRQFVGDFLDESLCLRACEGVDVLIHLGAVPDDAPFLTDLMPANVGGLYQTLPLLNDRESPASFWPVRDRWCGGGNSRVRGQSTWRNRLPPGFGMP